MGKCSGDHIGLWMLLQTQWTKVINYCLLLWGWNGVGLDWELKKKQKTWCFFFVFFRPIPKAMRFRRCGEGNLLTLIVNVVVVVNAGNLLLIRTTNILPPLLACYVKINHFPSLPFPSLVCMLFYDFTCSIQHIYMSRLLWFFFSFRFFKEDKWSLVLHHQQQPQLMRILNFWLQSQPPPGTNIIFPTEFMRVSVKRGAIYNRLLVVNVNGGDWTVFLDFIFTILSIHLFFFF